MLTRTARLLAGSVMATGMLIGSQAFALPSVTGAFTAGQNTWSDDSAELIVDNNGDGAPNMGDYVLGAFGITSFGSGTNPATVNQLSGIFALEISSATPQGAPPNTSFFTFKAPGAGLQAAFATAGIVVPLESTGTTAFEIFEGPPNTFTRSGPTFGFIVGTAVTPQEMMEWTITDGQITASAPTVLGPPQLPGLVGTGIGSFQGSATIFAQSFPGFTFDPTVALVGNNSIPNNPTAATNFDPDPAKFQPYSVRDDTTFTLTATPTPEPATLALVGLGLLGLGAVRRRS